MNNTNDLISSIASGNKSAAADMFKTIMNDKIATAVNAKMGEVGASMLKQDAETKSPETES
mgnify:FL=1